MLRPGSIAIVGASSDFSRINGRTLRFLLEKGYSGRIYPMNPKYRQIAGLECYPDAESLPEAPDLAILVVPARQVVQALRDLGRRGTRTAIVFSSGFAETGEAGRLLERETVEAAHAGGMRLCGPNCLGLINAFDRVMATFGQFAEGETPPGPVAFVTQSGAFGTAIAALARRRDLGLGYFINTGNEADVDFVQMMRAVLDDPRVTVGAGYVEGLRDGRGLGALADGAFAAGKPLVLTKVGRTAAGARAAASHTGALAGADAVFDGVMRGLGILRARNEEQMLDIVEVLARCARPDGNGIGIVTQSGGAGVLMADRAEELGLRVPELSAPTQRALQAVLPHFGTAGNPVDVTGQFVAEPTLLREAVRIVLTDPGIDIGIVWLQLMEAHADVLVELFEQIKVTAHKPFIVCWVAAPDAALRRLRAAGIAVLRGAEPAMDAAAALAAHAQARRDWHADRARRAALIRTSGVSLPADPGPVDALSARKILENCGVGIVPSRLAQTPKEAVSAAAILGYPVVIKIESPDIGHKTEVEGVRVALETPGAVEQAFHDVLAAARARRPTARLKGVLVQPMMRGTVELVIGLHRDPACGLVIMVGLGGIHVEVLKDVVFRQVPVTVAEAGRMLNQLRGRALLDGARGQPPVDRSALAGLVSTVSVFGAAADERLKELDLNPVLAGPDGAVAVDWLMVLE